MVALLPKFHLHMLHKLVKESCIKVHHALLAAYGRRNVNYQKKKEDKEIADVTKTEGNSPPSEQ